MSSPNNATALAGGLVPTDQVAAATGQRSYTPSSQPSAGRRVSSKAATAERIGVSPVTLMTMVRRGEFPPPVLLTAGKIGFFDDETSAWLESRPRTRAPDRLAAWKGGNRQSSEPA